MRITFVYMGAESLAIEYLSSVLKARGHAVSLAFDPALFDDKQYLSLPALAKVFSARKRLINSVVALKPDLVAFSVGTDIYAWALSMARDIKKALNVPVIFGGVHATAVPERVIANNCAIWAALRIMGGHKCVSGYGALLEKHLATN